MAWPVSRRPRRVLLISTQPFFQWRGSPIRVKFNLLALESLGMQVDLLAMPYGQADADVSSKVYRLPPLPGVRDLPIGPSPAKLVLDVLLLFRALVLAVRNRYDVIHATEEGGLIAWLAARLTGARCIYEKHSDPASYGGSGLRGVLMAAYAAVERFTSRHVDSVICTGSGLEQQVRRYAPSATVYHIPDIPSSLHEPDPVQVQALREKLRTSPGEVLATYVGSFATYQGIDLLFDAMPRALAAQGALRFLVIGGSEEEIAARRASLGEHAARVVFAGRIAPDELPAWLAASDLLLAPRLAGINTPLKLLDYFKAGGAIVATDTPANRLVLDERCARLSPARAEPLADAIVSLAGDEQARRAIGAEGRRRYLERYTFERFSQRLARVYDDLADGGRNRKGRNDDALQG